MAVAGLLVGELLMGHGQRRRTAVRRELDRHQRLPLGRRAPSPGEDEPAVRHHLTILAAYVMLLAARRTHHQAVASADARVAFGHHDFGVGGTEPALQGFRFGPGAKASVGRRREPTLEGEARLGPGRGGCGDGGLTRHGSSSFFRWYV